MRGPASACVCAFIVLAAPMVRADDSVLAGVAGNAAPAGGDPFRATAVRTENPPTIDGRLDDPVWADATVIENFTQVNPDEGAPPTERTVVRILYDDENLYVAFRCYDSEPDKIIAKVMQRDGFLRSDDRVALTIDTFYDKANGYFFEMNPVGSRLDALISNNRDFRREWDGIWYGKSSIDEEGWVAEMRIPTKTISFDPDSDQWGLNLSRNVRRLNEDIRWASPRRNSGLSRMADAGTIDGIEDLSQGIGLDIKPFTKLQYDADRGSFKFEFGGDIFYKLNPAVTATITLNTDFAETEVDERVVNLTRFPTFFPEKRDFFLQDEGIFSFGGIRRSPLPFFSRRIGIVGGDIKDIIAGGKVTGRTDNFEFGVLDVQMKHDDDLGDKNLAVGRAKYKFDTQNSLGLIGTVGDPANRHADNGVVGIDYSYDSSDIDGRGNRLRGDLYFMQTWSGDVDESNGGRGGVWGARIEYPNEPFEFQVFAGGVDRGFNPAMGFVRRSGEQEYFVRTRYRWRPGDGIRRIDLTMRGQWYVAMGDDQVNTANFETPELTIESDAGDVFQARLEPQRERLTSSFEISDGVTIPVGSYDFVRAGFDVRTTSARPISGNAGITFGDFYDGHREDYRVGLEWRPTSRFFLGGEYEQNEVTVSNGSFVTRVVSGRVNVFFTPDLSWTNLIQYDNVSDEIGVNSRVRWTITPGSDLFFVVNQGFIVGDDETDIDPLNTTITAKLGWTFRF